MARKLVSQALTGIGTILGLLFFLSVFGVTFGHKFSFGKQGYVAATLKRLTEIKQALLAFDQDIGCFPCRGSELTRRNLEAADTWQLDVFPEKNLLTNSRHIYQCGPLRNIEPEVFMKMWKGPYLEVPYTGFLGRIFPDPENPCFMKDAWANKIRFTGHEKGLYVCSAGKDGVFDPLSVSTSPGYSGDDLVMNVRRLKADLRAE
jgi:hypothetical protein